MGHPEIYDSKDAPIVDDAVQTEANRAELAYAAKCQKIMDDPSQKQKLGHIKEGSPQWNRICRYWEALLPEDHELICRLNEIKLVDLPEDELLSRLEKLNLVEESHSGEQTMQAAAHTSKLDIPQCDFPEYQQPLEDLIHKFQDIFSASTADVRKSQTSKKHQVQINLTSMVPVNVPNYRTPLKLRHVLKKLLDDLIEGGVIEKCENNEYNSPCLLVPKKAPEGAPQYRLMIDFRWLNKVIETLCTPFPGSRIFWWNSTAVMCSQTWTSLMPFSRLKFIQIAANSLHSAVSLANGSSDSFHRG